VKVFYLVIFLTYSLTVFGQELFDTSKRFSDGKNNYRSERLALHQKIIDKYLGIFNSKPKRKVPVVVFMAGGPGSGKSTGMRALDKAGILILRKYTIVDSDAIKELIPEYADFKKFNMKRAASLVHSESSYLKDRIYRLGVEKRVNLILDGTLSNYNKYKRVISSLKPLGHSVKIIYVKATLPELLRRVDARAKRTGRMVPHSFVKKSVKSIEESVSGLEKMVRATFYIDNERKTKIEKVVFPSGKTIIYNTYLDKLSKKKSSNLRRILENP
jgi:predicted ABC-type ATPase